MTSLVTLIYIANTILLTSEKYYAELEFFCIDLNSDPSTCGLGSDVSLLCLRLRTALDAGDWILSVGLLSPARICCGSLCLIDPPSLLWTLASAGFIALFPMYWLLGARGTASLDADLVKRDGIAEAGLALCCLLLGAAGWADELAADEVAKRVLFMLTIKRKKKWYRIENKEK
ncbi:hypothetical protein BX667DRAFT_279918 [Coemansia mojavensis]|nr:hypothetical protein BX667DRAFT_279918 [Coemansia mojavensis]